ncbi:thiamine pyrophosphate-dependent enzyme [Breoghania sp.]|uniref:thiamine pyrophosphate-dependent enzyme n=1 Tax=Breoghania sp. TaxID=2065378 RepID=UPI0026313190|nr:thiamine pyrophosphate-dependent enzyme [Breoghania sp.]MDJ0931686.1 thiamine pyrophosphate-dependent enzyme [Breoghania sp.]
MFGDTASYLKLGLSFPLPAEKIRAFAERVDVLYVVEEVESYLEDEIKCLGIKCIGKEKLPNMGELNPDIVRSAFFGTEPETVKGDQDMLVARPPVLCADCTHRGFFAMLRDSSLKQKVMIAGDIGCYGLGGADPLNAKDLCICMSSAPAIAHGAQKIFDSEREVVATIGDSTFFHTGIPSLIDMLYNHNRSNAILCVLDNRITGMTVQQENPFSGNTLQGMETLVISIEAVCHALGAENVRTVSPRDLTEVRKTLKWAYKTDGPVVIIVRWPCVLKKLDAEEQTQFNSEKILYVVNNDECTGCMSCINIGCPAISYDKEREVAVIDQEACIGCSACAQVCNLDAISPKELEHA